METLTRAVDASKKGEAALSALLSPLPPRELHDLLRLAAATPGTAEVRKAAGALLAAALRGKNAAQLLELLPADETRLAPPAAAAAAPPAAADPPPPAPLLEADVCVIGGGVSGAIIARDTASCGYTVVLVEQRHCVGGVWERTNYPGLRLHGLSQAYRAASLTPPWHITPHPVEGDHRGDIFYRPSCYELREYIEAMVRHERVDVRLNARYLSHRRDELDPARLLAECDGFRVRCRALVFATGANETLSGPPLWPFNPALVTNGATVMHAADMTERRAEFEAGERKFMVGSSKSATDILQTLDPADESFAWCHRGHIIMTKRPGREADEALRTPWPVERIRAADMGNQLLKKQQFKAHANLVIDSGVAHRVGMPRPSLPESRGGTASVEEVEHARKFVPRQVILDSCTVNDKGEVVLRRADGKPDLIVGPKDSIVFATGQRNDQGFKLYTQAANLNKDGVFLCLPYSTNTPSNAFYVTHELVSYLDGRPCAYTDGRMQAKLKAVVEHMKNLELTGAWAMTFAFMGAVQTDVCREILDYMKFRAGDLGSSYLWNTEWYGKELDFRETIFKLQSELPVKGAAPPKRLALTPDSWPVDSATAYRVLHNAHSAAAPRLASLMFPADGKEAAAVPVSVLSKLDPATLIVLRHLDGWAASVAPALSDGVYFSRILNFDLSWALADGIDKHAALSAVARAMPQLQELTCRGLAVSLPPLREAASLDGFLIQKAIRGGGKSSEAVEKFVAAAATCCAVAWSGALVDLDLKGVLSPPPSKKDTPLSLLMALAAAVVACPSPSLRRVKLHHAVDLNLAMMRAVQSPDGSTLNEHNYEGGWNGMKLARDGLAMLVGVCCPPSLNSTVAQLFLGNNELDDEILLLAGALEAGHLPKLATLGLSHNRISGDNFAALCLALGRRERPEFCVLGASANRVGNVGAQALFTALANGGMSGIMMVHLEENGIGELGFEKMANCLSQTRLQWFQELRLDGNNPTPRAVKRLCDVCRNRPGKIPALTNVDPETNPLYDVGDAFGGRKIEDIPIWEGGPDDPDSWFTVYSTDDEEAKRNPAKLAQMRADTKSQLEAWEASLPAEEKQRRQNRVKSAPQLWLEAGIRLANDPADGEAEEVA